MKLRGSRALLTGVAAALAIAGGRGCIDTEAIGVAAGGGGEVCGVDAECRSRRCADHVCCNVACTGACVSCNLPDHLGTCWPLPAGVAALHEGCLARPPCGQTGSCDGEGACSLAAANVPCAAPSCATDTLLDLSKVCDGHGSCEGPDQQDCSPYRCAAGGCPNRCSSTADCVPAVECVNQRCGPP
jgi:hypothetical protein